VAAVFAALVGAALALVHSGILRQPWVAGSTGPLIQTLFVVVLAGGVFLLVWRLNAALWRTAQVDAARSDSDLRLQELLAKGPGALAPARVRAERVQAAIYAISEAAATVTSLDELFRAIHGVVAELMPARNFYIALYDPATGLLSFPYFVDEVDEAPAPKPLGKGITEYVLRTGEPLLASPSVAADLEHSGQIELIGAPSIDWLGVPLKVGEETIGVLVVQSYTEGVRYSEEDRSILVFVSRQVAMAIARAAAQDARRASEQRLRDIVEHSTNLFYAHGPDHVLTYVSPQTRQFFDCEPEEALVRWTEFATDNPVNRAGFDRTERAIATGLQQPPCELELVGRQGREIWVEVREAPVVRDGRTVAVVGSLTDITERKRVEEALRASEATNRAILEAIPDIVFRLDGEGVFLDCKASRGQDLFARPELFLGRRLDEVLPGDLARASLDALHAALTSRQVQVFEYELPVAGEARLWECRMVACGAAEVVAIIREITERRRAEQALRESEERYRRLVELSPDGIAIHREGRLVFCNLTGARMLGYDLVEEAVGRPITDFVHPSYRDLVGRRVRDALADGKPQPPAEEKFIRADGSAIDVEVTSTPFTYGGSRAVLVVFRDITPRLKLEQHVRQMQKMEAIGRLAGGVAHDFNNLLQALLSTVEVMKVGDVDREKVSGTVQELETHVRRGAALTRQLLLFARREMVRSEPVDLNQIVASATTLLRRVVRETTRLAVDLCPEPLPLHGDRGQLEQVLVNLVVNASDAMPEGGEVTIRSGRMSAVEVWVEVSDTGVGIPAEVRGRIFEPFFTTKAAERGTGLGLAVVHGIVTQHGGRMEVTSEPGAGSTFRVVLPSSSSAMESPAPGQARQEPLFHVKGERILVVEDEEGARRALEEILQLLGFHVTGAATGEDAERIAAAGEFDVLLTDFVLPGIDGGELARRLTAASPRLRVILMSGYAEDETMRRSIRAGAVRFLQKPFDVTTLTQALQAALEPVEDPV